MRRHHSPRSPAGRAGFTVVELLIAAPVVTVLWTLLMTGHSALSAHVSPLRDRAEARAADLGVPLTRDAFDAKYPPPTANLAGPLAATDDLLTLADRLDPAAATPAADWPLDTPEGGLLLYAELPDVGHQRDLALAAAEAARKLPPAQRLRPGRVLLGYADAVGDGRTLVQGLNSIGIDALGSDVLADAALGLPGGEDGPEDLDAQVRQTIDVLLRDTPCEVFVRAYEGEAVLAVQAIDRFGELSPGPQPPAWLMRPWFDREVAVYLNAVLPRIAALRDADTLAAYRRSVAGELPDPDPNAVGEAGLLPSVSRLLLPNLDRAVWGMYRTTADRRRTAVALAARLWQRHHHGRLPPDLAALVPDYLPAVPVDPSNGGGEGGAGAGAVGYDPATGRIWTSGLDRIDNNGTGDDSVIDLTQR